MLSKKSGIWHSYPYTRSTMESSFEWRGDADLSYLLVTHAKIPKTTPSTMSTYDIQKVDSSPLLERSFSRNSLHAVITSVRRRLWGSSSKSSCTRSLAMVLTCSKNRLTVPRSLGSLFSSHFANSLHAYPTRPSYTHLWALTALLYCFPSRTPLMEPYATI